MGQGSPAKFFWHWQLERLPSQFSRIARHYRGCILIAAALFLITYYRTACLGQETEAEQFSGKLQIVWGGEVPEHFEGLIELSQGAIQISQNLSLQPDAVGKILEESTNRIQIRPHSKATYGGVEVYLQCDLSAELRIELRVPGTDQTLSKSYPVHMLLHKTRVEPVGNRGTRVAIERPIQDKLRIDTGFSSPIVNAKRYTLGGGATVEGYYTGLPAGRYLLRVQIPGEQPIALLEQEISVEASGSFPPIRFDFQTPSREGAFLIEATLEQESNYFSQLRTNEQKLIRRLEMLAFEAEELPLEITGWSPVASINAIEASTPGMFSWVASWMYTDTLPDSFRSTTVGQTFEALETSGVLGSRVLNTPQAKIQCLTLDPDTWLAIPLVALEAGHPYRLLIRTPQDRTNQLVASVKSLTNTDIADRANSIPETLGQDYEIMTTARQAAAYLADQEKQSGLKTTEITFWPSSTESVLVLANASDELASVLDIQLERAELAPLDLSSSKNEFEGPTRAQLLGLYMDKPLLSACLGSQRIMDPKNGRLLDSWSTWQAAASRLVQLLRWTESNVLVLKIQADGGAIYPSRYLMSCPQYDNGVFFTDGRQEQIKDGVGLLLKHLDRSRIKLIVCLALDTRFPILEQMAARGQFEGYQRNIADLELGEQYDPLDLRVQEQIMGIVRELLERYSDSPAFAGIQFELHADSPLVYKGDRWIPSASTLTRFQAETGIAVPGKSQNWESFLSSAAGKLLLQWRAEQLGEFYKRLGEMLQMTEQAVASPKRPRLFLNPGRLWRDSPEETDYLQTNSIIQNPGLLMLAHGFAFKRLDALQDIQVLRITNQRANNGVRNQDWITDISRTMALRARTGKPSAVLHMQKPRNLLLENLPPDSELRRAAGGMLYPLPSENTAEMHQTIMRDFAQEEPGFLGLGAWLPITLETSKLRDTFSAIRQLPSKNVTTSQLSDWISLRFANTNNESRIQLVNASPWEEQVSFEVSTRATPEILETKLNFTTEELGNGHTIVQTILPPFEIASFRFKQEVEVVGASRACAESVLDRLDGELEALESVLASIADPTRQPIAASIGGDFEWQENTPQNKLPGGWNASMLPSVQASTTKHLPHSGASCLQLASTAQEPVRAWVQSPTFDAPPNGRLTVQAWLRRPAVRKTCRVELRLVGRKRNGDRFVRSRVFGSQEANAIPDDWGTRPMRLDVGDIPSEEITSMFVAIELVGQGQIWVDDVEALGSWLHPSERIYLQRRLLVAKQKLQSKDPASAEKLLESPWVRYLRLHHPDLQTTRPDEGTQTASRTPLPAAQDAETKWDDNPSIIDKIRESLWNRWRR
ncbi:MAG: hypothetical protein AAF483_00200 [Planctomycetota bacterium]